MRALIMRCTGRRQFLQAVLAGMAGIGTGGCGTILYPERRGQPAGRFDWGVIALDGIGLLFFFVPGIIAFAVDFATGAIYLPPAAYPVSSTEQPRELITVTADREKLTPAEIERIVSTHAKQDVRLLPGQYETAELASVDQFWEARERASSAHQSKAAS